MTPLMPTTLPSSAASSAPYARCSMPLPQRSLAVVGADFPNKGRGPTRHFEIAMCRPGEPVTLVPEPRNKHDSRAVAVFSARGIQLGYLSAERCGLIQKMILEGREVKAVFQESTPFGAAIRLAFDGDEPALPAKQAPTGNEANDGDSDFWPDY